MKFVIPAPLKIEHEELHADLVKATKVGGKTGEVAKAVAQVLHDHFVKEEQYAMPPLGLLRALSEGRIAPEMAEATKMTDRLEADLDAMLADHQIIVGELKRLAEAAKAENRPEIVKFAEKLELHARTEEEVIYPASILVGRYLKLKLAERG
ncbi:hemerythrin domain-containing protein [Mesorhizobium sp. WSM4976]|uniref:hemerythrin domain-containing protein n=1 Tax=Mesorhizobium sp. WSM4976 TaxID=3038549 RepID=UPI002417D5AF|nr:hemerythrin domain-containing protein [Mesorhizobium sp. WSM4976]MDG4892508.1 hemerythrin domain-containing protein [Mesorhizobium sp. WSM4976]